MSTRKARRGDPIESAMEAAFEPGAFIPWAEAAGFVSGLERVQQEIEKLVRSEPLRAVRLYETFIAGCNEKAEEIDDSDGELGMFAGGLHCVHAAPLELDARADTVRS